MSCIGCRSYEKDNCLFLTSPYKDKVNIDKCPCKICLIKGVCHIACEEYTQNAMMYGMKTI
jgi:hypothetical protein